MSTPAPIRLNARSWRRFVSVAVVAMLGVELNVCSVRGQASPGQPPPAGSPDQSAPAKDAQIVKLNPAQIEAQMKVLTPYPWFWVYEFYLLNVPIERSDLLLSYYDPAKPWYYLPAVAQNCGFQFTMPLPHYMFKAANAKQERFVIVNGFEGQPLPIAVARGLADSFLAGLIAKLYLHSYQVEMELQLPFLSDEKIHLTTPPESDRLNAGEFSQAQAYTKVNKNGFPAVQSVSEDQYFSKMAEKARAVNLQPTAMLIGWTCAGDMIKEGDDAQAATWALVKNRFTERQIAKIAAYSIAYLEGWANGIASTALKPVQADKPVQAGKSVTEGEPIQTALEELGKASTGKERLSILLFRHLLSAYSCMIAAGDAQDQNKQQNTSATPPEKLVPFQERLEVMRENVEGFYEGTIAAGDDLFQAAYNLGFNSGYQKGLKDGYEAGFTAARQGNVSHEHVDVAQALSQAINQGKSVLNSKEGQAALMKQYPYVAIALTAVNALSKQPEVIAMKNKASNWVSNRLGFKVKF